MILSTLLNLMTFTGSPQELEAFLQVFFLTKCGLLVYIKSTCPGAPG